MQGGQVSQAVIERLHLDTLGEVADVHIEAFRGYMNVALGPRYVRAFLSWFCKASDGITFEARLDGRIVGYVVGAPAGYSARLTRDLAPLVAGAVAVRPWLVFGRDFRKALGARVRAFLGLRGSDRRGFEQNLHVSTVSLVGIGVAETARGRGVGAALMNAFESAAKERGMQLMRLTVYRENTAACRMYERAGWRAGDEHEGPTVSYTKALVSRS